MSFVSIQVLNVMLVVFLRYEVLIMLSGFLGTTAWRIFVLRMQEPSSTFVL